MNPTSPRKRNAPKRFDQEVRHFHPSFGGSAGANNGSTAGRKIDGGHCAYTGTHTPTIESWNKAIAIDRHQLKSVPITKPEEEYDPNHRDDNPVMAALRQINTAIGNPVQKGHCFGKGCDKLITADDKDHAYCNGCWDTHIKKSSVRAPIHESNSDFIAGDNEEIEFEINSEAEEEEEEFVYSDTDDYSDQEDEYVGPREKYGRLPRLRDDISIDVYNVSPRSKLINENLQEFTLSMEGDFLPDTNEYHAELLEKARQERGKKMRNSTK